MAHLPPVSNSLSDSEETERNAYNAAFYELGLRWHWDIDTYQELRLLSDHPGEWIRMYLQNHQSHLLKAYDVDFLVNAIEMKKTHCQKTMSCTGSRISPYFNWAETHAGELGV